MSAARRIGAAAERIRRATQGLLAHACNRVAHHREIVRHRGDDRRLAPVRRRAASSIVERADRVAVGQAGMQAGGALLELHDEMLMPACVIEGAAGAP